MFVLANMDLIEDFSLSKLPVYFKNNISIMLYFQAWPKKIYYVLYVAFHSTHLDKLILDYHSLRLIKNK